jgi:Tfp pilus assembly protein PilN
MMRFDYLADAPPHWLDRLRSLRLPEAVRTPLMALLTSMLVVLAWYGLESYWVAKAMTEEQVAAARHDRSRAELARTQLERLRVEDLVVLENRLHSIRQSGANLSRLLADVASHVPEHAWLTSISNTSNGFEIAGEARGLTALSQTLADLTSGTTFGTPTLVRAGREARASSGDLLSFTVRVEARVK